MINTNSLYEKEIISITDGSKIGEIYDIEIDEFSGKIISIIVLKRSIWFLKKEKNIIPWKCVKVIGDETILVDNITLKNKSQESLVKNFLD